MLHPSPEFSLIAIGTMALGVGVTAATYSVIDTTLLNPLFYPSELVRIEANPPGVGRTTSASDFWWHFHLAK